MASGKKCHFRENCEKPEKTVIFGVFGDFQLNTGFVRKGCYTAGFNTGLLRKTRNYGDYTEPLGNKGRINTEKWCFFHCFV